MSDDPDRSLACSTRADARVRRRVAAATALSPISQKGGKRAYTVRLVKDRSPRHRRKGLHRPFTRPRHARRRATLAEIYSAIRSSHTSCLKSAPTSECLALRQWRAFSSPTGVRSFVPAPASPRRRNRRATGRRQDVVYQKPPILRLAQQGPRRRAR